MSVRRDYFEMIIVISCARHDNSSASNLINYLKYLHRFRETFGLHRNKSTSVKVEITQESWRLEQVYSFDKKCVDAVMNPY